MKKRTEDRYDLVHGTLASRVDTAEMDDRISLSSAFCELANRTWTQQRRVEAYSLPTVKVRSAKEAAGIAAEWMVASGKKRNA